MNISVVIPAYNAERFLQRSIRSVLEQTEPPFEVIVIDDGSSDQTAAVAASFGNHIQYVRQQNGGPAKARNAGLRVAKGEWIAFLDADDWWRPEKLHVQKKRALEDPEALVVYTGMQIFGGQGEALGEAFTPPIALWPQFRWRNMLTPSCVMVQREALLSLGGFDENQKGCEDWGAWFKLIRRGRFIGIAEPLTCYSRRPASLSSDASHMFQDFSKMLDTTLLADLSGLRRWLWRRRIMSYQAYSAAMTARASIERDIEMRFLVRSLLQWPSPFWQPKRYLSLVVTLKRRMRPGLATERNKCS